jgi:hypothetical protein
MTIGINPNLTAFGAGRTGASWCYPSFSDGHGTDSFAKYAYYYRYRSVYQEHFDFKFSEKHLLKDSQILAEKAGTMLPGTRPDDNAAYDIHVQYDGESTPTAVHVPGKLGEPAYVVPIDAGQRFTKGGVLAAKLSVPAGEKVKVYDQPIGYYMQIVPVLAEFEAFLKANGHADAHLHVGEDVGQLDMVACASPHWGPQWLGGTTQAVNTVVANCVHKNAWAMKQLVQTQPAVLFLVGQASWNMFRRSFGHLIHSAKPLPTLPEDGPYTLLRLTSEQDCRLEFSTRIAGKPYELSTRVVITPHFSYDENFVPQFRMSPEAFAEFEKREPAAAAFLQQDPRINFQKKPGTFVAAGFEKNAAAVMAQLKHQFSATQAALKDSFYDPHAIMAGVLKGLYGKELTYTYAKHGRPGHLSRTNGPCQFCVNSKWKFPQGCPYGKPDEQQYDIGFLEKVAEAMLKHSEAVTEAHA